MSVPRHLNPQRASAGAGPRRRTAAFRGTIAGVTALAALLLAGCGSSSSGGSPAAAATGTASTATDAATAPASTSPATTPPAAPTSSADVSTNQSLTAWAAAVCTASKDTFDTKSLTPDYAAIQKDPSKAAQSIREAYGKLGERLSAFADQLEQIGAPDIPNGKKFTDAYIDYARKLSAAFASIKAKISTSSDPAAVLASVGTAFQGSDIERLSKEFTALNTSINTPEFEKVTKSVAECKDTALAE